MNITAESFTKLFNAARKGPGIFMAVRFDIDPKTLFIGFHHVYVFEVRQFANVNIFTESPTLGNEQTSLSIRADPDDKRIY